MENKQSDLEQFLKRLARCGDFGLAAQRAKVSNQQLNQWLFNNPNPDINRKIILARVKANLRKNLRTPLMTREDFVTVLRKCHLADTKSFRRNDQKIITLLIKNPHISNEDGARKLKITVAAYKMRKKRLLKALFDRLTIR